MRLQVAGSRGCSAISAQSIMSKSSARARVTTAFLSLNTPNPVVSTQSEQSDHTFLSHAL